MIAATRTTLITGLGLLIFTLASCSSDDGPTGPGATDTTSPTVLSVSPSQDETNVSTADDLVVTFNEAMTALTNVTSVTLTEGTVTGLTWSTDTTLLVSHTAWANGTNVQATLAVAFSDTAGNGLATPYIWDFWTMTTAPQVLESSIGEGTTGVNRNATISFLFSSEMNLSSLSGATSLTNNGVVPKGGTGFQWTSGEGTRVNLSFSPTLEANTSYTVDIAATAQTNTGTPLGTAFQLNFVTGATADTTPPNLVSVTPANGSVIPTSTSSIVLTFDEAIDANSLNLSKISAQFDNLLTSAGIDVTVSPDGTQLTVPLPSPLPAGLPIMARFDSYADQAGNVQSTPIDYRVDVAGSPMYWQPIGSTPQVWTENWNDQPTVGPPDSGSGSFYTRSESSTMGQFQVAEYDDFGLTVLRSFDAYNVTSTALQLAGFGDNDQGVITNTDLSPDVDYFRLPPAITSWSGNLTATDPDGTTNVNYTLTVISKGDLDAQILSRAPKVGPTRIWVDTWKATLEYTFTAPGSGTMLGAGVDSLWFAPATGLVRRWSTETSPDGNFESVEQLAGPLLAEF